MQSGIDVYDTICLTIAANDDQIRGRTTIQKLIYFELIKIPEIQVEPHIAYYYGPFNRQVAQGLETLVHLGVLDEKKMNDGNSAYQYSVTEKGQPVIKDLIKTYEKTYERIENIVETCYNFCQLNPNPLSFAAKVHYMLSKRECEKGMTNDEAIKMAKSFGWKITEKEVKSGAELLESLNLVKIRR